jgi:hypothetical protein
MSAQMSLFHNPKPEKPFHDGLVVVARSGSRYFGYADPMRIDPWDIDNRILRAYRWLLARTECRCAYHEKDAPEPVASPERLPIAMIRPNMRVFEVRDYVTNVRVVPC